MSGEYTRALQDIHIKLDWLIERVGEMKPERKNATAKESKGTNRLPRRVVLRERRKRHRGHL